MEDMQIIALFWRRDEQALTELTRAHKRPCMAAAREITGSEADAEECFNDTCLALWNAIPPQKPASLRAYAMRICRNLALNRAKAGRRQKRSAILVELEECTSLAQVDAEPGEIGRAIDSFLEIIPRREAVLFVRRYFYSQPVKEIAAGVGMTENQVSKILQKLRGKLKKHLEKEGIGL